ncbi:MAG: tRNA (adenosine(37)-N6)-threonylcarbamoyltransferase complex ATPase subunit type 1 TsaE [Bacteroidetes bacterium]|nr:tRNA (adenosine(37)-N6)-threonylcarbamoyltransferase complex ATPase subunit type 1 TsaE [Bacteroidota bacterium]
MSSNVIYQLEYTLEQVEVAASELITKLKDYQIWAFKGDLGAGKTTLIKSICQVMGSEDTVTSPTFTLVNEYMAAEKIIYHFDFYRINNPQEAMDFGLFEYIDSGSLCLMEWPEKIDEILKDEKVAYVTILKSEDQVFRIMEVIAD